MRNYSRVCRIFTRRTIALGRSASDPIDTWVPRRRGAASHAGAARAGRSDHRRRAHGGRIMRSDAPKWRCSSHRWDTHANQGGATGVLAQRLPGLTQRCAARDDLVLSGANACCHDRIRAHGGDERYRGTDTDRRLRFLVGAPFVGTRHRDWPGLAPHRSSTAAISSDVDLRSGSKVLDEHLHIDAKTLARGCSRQHKRGPSTADPR